MTAAGRSAVPFKRAGILIKLLTVAMNPSKPTVTAPCIRCFRKFSFALEIAPKTTKIKPKNAGISAVTLALPFIIP